MAPGTAELTIRGVGAVTLGCAIYGFYFNFSTFRSILRRGREPDDPPYFREAFYVLSAICIFFYVVLGWIGTEFVLGRSERWAVFVTILVAEIIYVAVVGALWARSKHAMSIGAATGVSIGGLMAQLFILLPIWGPVVVWLARRSIAGP
jgi:hypothetical protein